MLGDPRPGCYRPLSPGIVLANQEENRRVDVERQRSGLRCPVQGRELFVETKWRSDPAPQFGGRTLQALVQHLPPGARSLVVVNAPPMPRAYAIVKGVPGERGRIVMWRDVRDDHALGEALASLLGSAGQPASRQS
jgi:hypothetical protein